MVVFSMGSLGPKVIFDFFWAGSSTEVGASENGEPHCHITAISLYGIIAAELSRFRDANPNISVVVDLMTQKT